MRAPLLRSLTIASVTLRDLLRRPGTWLALSGTAILLAILPRLATRALDDGAALATELALSTVWLHAGAFAAIAGVQAAARDAPLGPSPELLVTPLSPREYTLGRVAGVAAASLVQAAALLMLAAGALWLSGGLPDDLAALSPALVLGALQLVLLSATAVAIGALCDATLGTVAVLGLLVAMRLLIPVLTAAGDPWSWWLPDAARLDLSREAAFGRPVGAMAIAAAAVAALLQCVGALWIAAIALSLRTRDLQPVER